MEQSILEVDPRQATVSRPPVVAVTAATLTVTAGVMWCGVTSTSRKAELDCHVAGHELAVAARASTTSQHRDVRVRRLATHP
jgi:hypothetical protein